MRWGETLDIEETYDSTFARKRLCIKTNLSYNILECFKVIYRGKIYMVRAKELFTWTPQFRIFKNTDYMSDEDSPVDVGNKQSDPVMSDEEDAEGSDDEEVPNTVVGEELLKPDNNIPNDNPMTEKQISDDPFGVYELLNKSHVSQHENNIEASPVQQIQSEFVAENDNSPMVTSKVMNFSHISDINESSCGVSSPKFNSNMGKGGSILNVLDDLIRVGQSMGYDMEGCSRDIERIIALQETKMDNISHMDVKLLWGNSNYQFVSSDSAGNSGGILCVWEDSIFRKDSMTVSDNFIALFGTWLPNNSKVLIVAVYAPQSPVHKRLLWDYISGLIARWHGDSIVFGDFNEVRCAEERFGSQFHHSSAREFNNFIASSGLVEIKSEGYSYTWSHPSATKMSKLDRFLVSEGIISHYSSVTTMCLDRHLSDHRPILLKEVDVDFGPTPFRIFHSWFNREGFDAMVNLAWNSFTHSDSNHLIRFKKKLQALKVVIRDWIKEQNALQYGAKRGILEELTDIDKRLDQGEVADELLEDNMIRYLDKTKSLIQGFDRFTIRKSKRAWIDI
ncbi:RNA-directed DNA polymerase, eukaryota [Tanacetum coccineum]